MNVAAILKIKGRAVATVRTDATLQDVAEKLAKRKIGAMVIIGPGGRSKRCGDENESPEPGKNNKHDIDLRATAAKPPFTSGRLMRAIAAKMWQGAQAPQPHFE